MATAERPTSTRASKKGARAGGDTMKAMKKELDTTRKRLREREKKISMLEQDKKNMKQTMDALESWKRKTSNQMAKEQKIRTGAVSERQEMRAYLEKTQRAIAARLGLIGIDFRKCKTIRDALDAAISAINHLANQVEEKDAIIKKLEEELEALRKRLADLEAKYDAMKAKFDTQQATIDEQNCTIKDQGSQIKKLEKVNKSQEEEIERLRAQLEAITAEHAAYKEESSTQLDEMRARIAELEGEQKSNLEEIEELKRLIKELRDQIANLTQNLEEKGTNLEELQALLKARDKELGAKDKLIAKLKARIAELEAELESYVNRPKADKETNTILTGDINHQLTDYPRLLKAIVELRNILSQKNDLIAKLTAENRELLAELEILMKKLVAFRPSQTNHSLPVKCLATHPNKYVFATGSEDTTVRLWKVDPDHKNASKRVMVFKQSTIESRVDCVAWNHDGTLLACGTSYRGSPDGYVVIWCMTDDDPEKYNAVYAIRSRPTVRFGKVRSIEFSNSMNPKQTRDQFVYCGDTTGSIWVFDLAKEAKVAGTSLIGVIQSHNDIIYDMAVTLDGKFLYSVSHDQTMAVFELVKQFGGERSAKSKAETIDFNNQQDSKKGKKGGKGKLKKTKSTRSTRKLTTSRSVRNVGVGIGTLAVPGGHAKNEDSATIKLSLNELLADENATKLAHYAGVVINQNDKYPFWKVCVSADGQRVICASRKIKIMVLSGNPMTDPKANISDGPKVPDGDLDHIKSLVSRNGKLVTCRKKVDRIKVFDIESGQEIKKFAMKKPIQAVDFLGDNAHIIACCQKSEGSNQPPLMKLVKYSDKRIEIAKETDVDVNLLQLNIGGGSDYGNSIDFDANAREAAQLKAEDSKAKKKGKKKGKSKKQDDTAKAKAKGKSKDKSNARLSAKVSAKSAKADALKVAQQSMKTEKKEEESDVKDETDEEIDYPANIAYKGGNDDADADVAVVADTGDDDDEDEKGDE